MNIRLKFRGRTTALVCLAAMALFAQCTAAVKTEDFKTCEQAAFCKRHRSYADSVLKQGDSSSSGSASPYAVIEDSVQLTGYKLLANMQHVSDNVPLQLEVSFLQGGTVRVRVQEVAPLKPRYDGTQEHTLRNGGKDLPYVSEGDLKHSTETVSGTTVHTVSYTSQNSTLAVRMSEKPWSLEYINGDKPVIQLNTKGLFNFEHLRAKDDASSDSIEGGWDESFRSWTDSKPNGPESFGLDVSFNGFSHVYGIPEHASPLSLKTTRGEGDDAYNEPYRMWNLDVFEYLHDSPMALYGAIPFMVAHNKMSTVGALWLNAAETWIDVTKEKTSSGIGSIFGRSSSSKEPAVTTHWISESGILDVFLLPGPSVADMYAQYKVLVETTPLPRDFSIGYHQCRWNYLDQDDVLSVNAKFSEHDIPYDVIWLDIEHTVGRRYFTWDTGKFPDPAAMQDQLAADGRKLVTIVDPHIKRDAEYRIWKEASDNGYFVKNKDGTESYQGWCWPGDSSWVDYLNPKAAQWFSEQYHLDKYNGSTKNLFIWNDMNEPSVFNGPEITMEKDLRHYGDWEHRDVHNIFGMLYHKATSDGLRTRESPSTRPFSLSRAYYVGSQRYGAIWTGDNSADWDHLRVSVPMVLSNNLAGMHFVGADVGGFFGNPDSELLTRWYQLGIWYPFFRAHAHIDTKRREPWLLGEPYTSHIRDAIRERYRLLPYWYTLFREANVTGLPIIRPMWMEFPEETRLFADQSSFMVGSAIMVVPVVEEGANVQVDVQFPADQVWYDMHTLDTYSAPLRRQFTAGLADTFVFARGGSIVPTRERHRASSVLMRRDPFTLYVFVGSDGAATGRLYVDDGESYDYSKGAFVEREISFKGTKLVSRPSPEDADAAQGASEEREAFLKSIDSVRIERIVVVGVSDPVTKAVVTENGVTREIELEDGDRGKSFVVRDPAVRIYSDWDITLS